MTVHMPKPLAADLEQIDRDTASAAQAGARRRSHLAAMGLGLTACAALAVLVYYAPPAARASGVEARQAMAACSRIYDSAACSCAVESMAPGEGYLVASGDAPNLSGNQSRPVVRNSRDFAHLVQACMARGRDAPVD